MNIFRRSTASLFSIQLTSNETERKTERERDEEKSRKRKLRLFLSNERRPNETAWARILPPLQSRGLSLSPFSLKSFRLEAYGENGKWEREERYVA